MNISVALIIKTSSDELLIFLFNEEEDEEFNEEGSAKIPFLDSFVCSNPLLLRLNKPPTGFDK